MTEAIRLYWGRFGHVSVLNVASDFVTHAHVEAHVIIWLEGTAGEMTIGRETVRPRPRHRRRHQLLPAAQPCSCRAMAGTGCFSPSTSIRTGHAGAATCRPAAPLFSTRGDHRWSHGCTRRRPICLTISATMKVSTTSPITRSSASSTACSMPPTPRRRRMARARVHTMQDFRVRKAIQLMKANVCERICFDDVARSVGLSRPHFFALFKEQTNLTPNVYWNTLRMEEAVRQLQWSQEPLISVACNLGFTTQGNFSRFFRDHVGVPPTLYREAARASLPEPLPPFQTD